MSREKIDCHRLELSRLRVMSGVSFLLMEHFHRDGSPFGTIVMSIISISLIARCFAEQHHLDEAARPQAD